MRLLDEMVLRYLGAFGPAPVKDVQTWSGLTRLSEVTIGSSRACAPSATSTARNCSIARRPKTRPATPSPPRFLPEFDNLILSHADRTRIIVNNHRKMIASKNGMVPATVLVDGFVRGTWKTERDHGKATVAIDLLEPLPNESRESLAAEGEQLIRFVTEPEGAEAFEVRFAEKA